MTARAADPRRAVAADAIMRARVHWGWTFGKRRRVMAIDLIMAEAAIAALDKMEKATEAEAPAALESE